MSFSISFSKLILFKASLFLFAIGAGSFVQAQQFRQYEWVDSLLVSQHYYANTGACGSTMDVDIRLNSTLYNYVDGLTFTIVIDSVNYSGPPCCIMTGDTVVLNAENPAYSKISGTVSDLWFRVLLQGTPTQAQQRYPCELSVIQCACGCVEMEIMSTGTSDCYVDAFESIENTARNSHLEIYPNPSSTGFSIQGMTDIGQIVLYNAMGERVLLGELGSYNYFNTSNLNNGIYTAVVTNGNQVQIIKEVVVLK